MSDLVPTGFPQTAPIVEGTPSPMPSDRGLGLMDSYKLTRDIGSQTSGESNLPRFGALDEVKPLRPACLFLIMMIMGYNGVPNSSAEISSSFAKR